MSKKILLLCFLALNLLLSGCASRSYVTKQQAYPEMYKQKPLSIMVLPAVNRSTAADAPDLYATTIAPPLAEAGYYVLPLPITNMLMRNEGVVDGEQLANVDVKLLKEAFGADAVLFVTINQWDTNYYVTGGNVTVGASFRLVATSSNQELWQHSRTVVYNTSGNSGSLLVDLISTAISTATTDYVPIARIVNSQLIYSIPAGKYSPYFGKDGEVRVLEQPKS